MSIVDYSTNRLYSVAQTEKFNLDFQVWDKDLLSANDFIGSVAVPILPVISACIANVNKVLYNHQEDVELEVNTKAVLKRAKSRKSGSASKV